MIRWLLLMMLSLVVAQSAAAKAELMLMPYPQQVTLQEGSLTLGKHWALAVEGKRTAELSAALKRFSQRVAQQTGIVVRWKTSASDKAHLVIRLQDASPMSPRMEDWDESYQLQVDDQRITLSAAQQLGILRGLETLLQLIGTQEKPLQLPQVTIQDFPRFPWRGVLLDSSRHFLSIDTLKRQLDAMAAAKYSIFHWHLTDDQGWRFESARYPKLHRLASDGQFYTRKQMREIVAYARARGIQVLPEIDMPGHASAIAVAYPELMSAPGPYNMEYRWGVHKPTLDPTNEKVYAFIDALIAEVAAIFPFEYLHMGGDEVDPEHWQNNAAIQAFMQKNAIPTTQALQAYFNQRVQKLLQQHERKMIGWDEILHKDLPQSIVIQSWQGPDAVSESVAAGYHAILSTGYYLDQPQRASYHYRNDPLPPAPYTQTFPVSVNPHAAVAQGQWFFSLPRKRGNPVTGHFALFQDAAGNTHGFVDFTGKSRRAVKVHSSSKTQAIFSLDTWMGPVEFRAEFAGEDLTGRAIVGNAPYAMSGKKVAPETLATFTQMTPLSAQDHARVLGGEAALWAEIVDEHSIDLRLWPRAFVVGERLWSAQKMQDENSLYQRMNVVAHWAEKSTGLLHRRQTEVALRRLAKTQDIGALLTFIELLEPAHYYHRQHEKSAKESYSKADPLNRLVDALPAENDALYQFNRHLQEWLQNPAPDDRYQALLTQLRTWKTAQDSLSPFFNAQPSLTNLAQKTESVIQIAMTLLAKRAQREPLTANEKFALEKTLADSLQIEEEIIVALIFSVENLLNSF